MFVLEAPINFGNWLKREIERRLLTQEEVSAQARIPYRTVRVWIGAKKPNIRGTNLEKLAAAMKMSREEIEELLRTAADAPDEGDDVTLDVLNRPGETVTLPALIPLEGGVSASRFADGGDDVGDVIRFDSQTQFALRCEGDCMEPDYHDGELVVFSSALVDSEGIIDGDDYGIRLEGEAGKTTFKRAWADPRDRECLILRCANSKKHKQQLRVCRAEIARIGKAIWAMRRPRKRGA